MLTSDQAGVVCFGALIERNRSYLTVKFQSLDILTKACRGQGNHHFGLLNDSCYRQIGPYAELEDRDLLDELRKTFEGYTECSAVVVVSGELPLSFANIGRVPVSINVYGSREHKDAIGNGLESFDLYLQNPESVPTEIIYDNPHVLGGVDQTMIGGFSEEFRWRSVMRLIICNFMPLEHEMLQLIRWSFESGLSKGITKMNHSKALYMAKGALLDWAAQNHVEVEKMAGGAIISNLELAPCPCSDCTSQS
ncbi:hypothetical protein V8C37DRAFT_397806 [Trichoderma ceciliae]